MRLVPRIFGQSLGILALSGLLAFAVNAARPDGLPLAQAAAPAAPSAVQLAPGAAEIALKDAALLFLSGRAVFLDARSQFEYELGHIKGAINLSPREFASRFQDVKPQLLGKEAVIAYCDGEGCPLARNLVEHLRAAGIKNALVLKNGWSLWQAEKLPTAQGQADRKAQASDVGQPAQKAPAQKAAVHKPRKAQVAPKAPPGQSSQTLQPGQSLLPGHFGQSGQPLGLKAPGQDALCTDCAN